MTRYFSVHEALDTAEAVLFAELMTFAVLFHAYSSRRHSAFNTARPWITARGWAPRSQSLRAYHGQGRQ
jgi:heme/copper-type cytochrome/quinol oxidase subunit 3